jgi:protein-S-isoprenylcysteine O-methyltransferase Ste14
MKIDTVEKAVRLVGGVASLVTVGTILQGLRRSSQREIGKEGDKMLTTLHRPAALAAASAAGLAVLSGAWRPLPLNLPRRMEAALTLVGSALFFAGISLFHWGRRTMGAMYDVSTSRSVQLYADHRLVTSGPFAHVRHPLYVAGTLAEVGALLMYRTWTTALIALNIASLVLRSRKEEATLAEQFGDEWTRYAAQVPAWVPRLSALTGCCAKGSSGTTPGGDQPPEGV